MDDIQDIAPFTTQPVSIVETLLGFHAKHINELVSHVVNHRAMQGVDENEVVKRIPMNVPGAEHVGQSYKEIRVKQYKPMVAKMAHDQAGLLKTIEMMLTEYEYELPSECSVDRIILPDLPKNGK